MLAGMREAGCDVVDYGTVADDEAALESVLRRAAGECGDRHQRWRLDGGVRRRRGGAGPDRRHDVDADRDQARQAVRDRDLSGKPIFGLPGNPVSSIISFEMLARPALRRMMGHRRLAWPITSAIGDDGVNRRPDGKVHLVRVAATFENDGRCHAASVGAQGSHQLGCHAPTRSPSCPTVTASRPGPKSPS